MNKEMNGIHVYLIINHISIIAIKVIYKFQPICFVTLFFFSFGDTKYFSEVKNLVQR